MIFFITSVTTSEIIFMFQCNEHVEMNKFCVVWHAPAWMSRIDRHFYIIDVLSLDVSLE